MSLYLQGRSAVVQAGAGSGKTHSLVTLCLHLLGGAGRAEPLLPGRLCAVTFTEKAAAELRGRLRSRVDRLAVCESPAALAALAAKHEPELAASCAAAGTALPAPEAWRKIRRDLGQAEIGTIHGLCSRLLRRHAAAAGLDPDFTVLDEADAAALRREACEQSALDALDEPPGAGAAAAGHLCAELGFRAAGPFGGGLAEALLSLLARLGESGRDPADVVEQTPGLLPAAAVAADAAARAALEEAVTGLELLLRAPGARAATKVAAGAAEAVALLRGSGLAALRAAPPGELSRAWPALEAARARLGRRDKQGIALATGVLKDAFDQLLSTDAGVRACTLARELALLASRALLRYRAEKARLSALDFDDLTRLSRDLLARDPAARRLEKARLGALLIDEFQDTSQTQLELFGWLAEDPAAEGTAPAGSGLPGALPIHPGRFALVGDRKQSIYEFRGADLGAASAFATRALEDGAELSLLRDSRRSVAPLVAFVNLLFRRALGDGGLPFEAPFKPGEDDLRPLRPDPGEGPCAELLDVSGGTIDDEADAVGRRIAQLLAPGAPERVRERTAAGEEQPRPVRGGDVAVLLRSFTHVEAFRAALLRRRVPHLVVKGRGFHETREVGDLRALLQLLVDPRDPAALAAVLRSPLGPLSDDALVLLARGPGSRRRLSLRALRDPDLLAPLAPDDAAAAARLLHLIDRLSRDADRLGPAALLEIALAETGYTASIAGGLFGEQAVANVERLLLLAQSAERASAQPGGSLRALLARLEAMDGQRGEAEAPVVEEKDPHAVRLLTVHAAKGLEFPVVFVPLCALVPRTQDQLLLDPELGLALKVRGADGAWNLGPHGARVQARRERRALAEGRRLFYVAATRARDRLVLAGREHGGRTETWRHLIDQLAGSAEAAPILRVLPAGALLAPPLPAAGAAAESLATLGIAVEDPAAAQLAEAAVARVLRREARPRDPGTLVAPVTQLADAVACPQRYRLLHEAGLEERPGQEPFDHRVGNTFDNVEGEAPALPAAERGTLAHRLLELVPLVPDAPAPALRASLRRVLEQDGLDPGAHEAVTEAAAAFLGSELGRRMAQVAHDTPNRLLRELPFLLRLEPLAGEPPGPRLLLRGQLDALLLDEGFATVIDYKHAEQRDPERYALQLQAYALAAHRITAGAAQVRAGLVFLRSRGAPLVLRPASSEVERAETRTALLGAARAIEEGRRTGRFPLVEPARCRALGCGFLPRCHPEVVEARAST